MSSQAYRYQRFGDKFLVWNGLNAPSRNRQLLRIPWGTRRNRTVSKYRWQLRAQSSHELPITSRDKLSTNCSEHISGTAAVNDLTILRTTPPSASFGSLFR